MLRPTRKLSMLGLGGAVLVASVSVLGTRMGQVGAGVTDPTFTLNSTQFMPGEAVMFSGTGWTCTAGADVTIRIATMGVVATPTPDGSGAISGSFTAPTALGHYLAVAHGHVTACGIPLTVPFDVVSTTTTSSTSTTSSSSTTSSTSTTTPSTTIPTAHSAPISSEPVPVTD